MRRHTSDAITARILRARSMIERGWAPIELEEGVYLVNSESQKDKQYSVLFHKNQWSCDCPDFTAHYNDYRHYKDCKHIYSVKYWLVLKEKEQEKFRAINQQVQKIPLIIDNKPLVCSYCGSSNIIKNGSRKTKVGIKTRILCHDCNHTFTLESEEGFIKMQSTSKMITAALDLYFKSTSLRKIADHLEQFYERKIHFTTIYYWVKKYGEIISEYTETLTPTLGNIWHTDEMKIKTKREDWAWLWNIIDGETRYLIANLITQSRDNDDATHAFNAARTHVPSIKPRFIITDGLPAYNEGFFQTYYDAKWTCEHIRSVGIRSKVNNNRIERFNNTVRERNKTMRGLHNDNTAMVFNKGFKAYYNHIRRHQSLQGMTPAQAAGININLGENRWKDLIQKSIEHNKAQAL